MRLSGSELPPVLRAELDAAEWVRADSFRNGQDREAYIAAHALLSRCVRQVAGAGRAEWRFATDANGKPHVIFEGGTLHTSLSHTRGAVAVVLSHTTDIGVDIEAVAPFIVRDVLTEREIHAVSAARDPAGTFTRFWTRKEALAKAFGVGIYAPFAKIDVLYPAQLDLPPEMDAAGVADVPFPGRFALSVAVRHGRFDLRSIAMSPEDFIEEAACTPDAA
jgi:4'-phosphopantetheinyl transferase